MTANLVKNIWHALQKMPVKSITIWLDSRIALYWIASPGKPWKVFVANLVRKITAISKETGINWKHVSCEINIADAGSRGGNLEPNGEQTMVRWPWMVTRRKPVSFTKPPLSHSAPVKEEEKPVKEIVGLVSERLSDEWDVLLQRKPYWNTLRITSWALRFVYNCRAKRNKGLKRNGRLPTKK